MLNKLRNLFRVSTLDQDLDDEVRFHVEEQTAQFVRQGISEKQAALMARRQFGNATLHKEECRDTRNFAWLENIAQDFRHSARTLRRNPGFTAVSVLTLAIGIGATTAMFSVVDHALLRPVIAHDADRLIWLQEFSKGHNESGSNPARLADWQQAHSFRAIAGTYGDGAIWTSPAGPVRLSVLRFFGDLSGVMQPALQMGRNFTASEASGQGDPVALLTNNAFHQRFQANRAILNQPIRLGGALYQIIGVLSADIDFPNDVDLWTPSPIQFPSRAAGFLNIIGRLAPGVSITQAQAEIDLLSSRFAQQYSATDDGRSAQIVPLADFVSNAARKPLLVLFGAVASILFIGCLNIGGLLLARGLSRRREAAIRVSVGAGYARLARLFFAESLLLSAGGCILGLLVAVAGVDLLKVTLPAEVPNLSAVTLDLRVAFCAIVLSLLAALIFGALPAWQFARNAKAVSVGITRSGLRSSFVIAQVAISLVLLVTATLLASSFLKVLTRSLGFNTAHAYTFSLNLPWDSKESLTQSLPAETLARLGTLPGTIAAGVVDRLPMQGGSQTNHLVLNGQTLPPLLAEKEFGFRTATAGYFTAAGIPLIKGAIYRDWQNGKGVREAVVSQRLAELFFPNEDPLGHEIASAPRGATQPEWFRIVGVIRSVPSQATAVEPAAELYVPWGATYWPIMSFVVRTEGRQADISRLVHNDLQKLVADQIFSPVASLEERTAETRSTPRTAALLVGGFAFVALALSALGIFGLMAHETTRRTQEIGVRLALGAEPESIAWDAILRAVKLVAAGIVLGLAASWYASTLINGLLFSVEPHDILSYASAAAVLLTAAVLASLLPALRAARINPIQALRHE